MERHKYPRTPHLPWSKGATSDDKTLGGVHHFMSKHVVVTEKMDGENTSLYSDGYIHARSIDGRNHFSRNWIKSDWAAKHFNLTPGFRILGENLYAKHSIHYVNLQSFFYMFGVADSSSIKDWDTVEKLSKLFNYPTPNILYDGIFDESVLYNITKSLSENVEGYVIRVKNQFNIDQFETSVAKYVRANHVQTDKHWMHSELVKNLLDNHD